MKKTLLLTALFLTSSLSLNTSFALTSKELIDLASSAGKKTYTATAKQFPALLPKQATELEAIVITDLSASSLHHFMILVEAADITFTNLKTLSITSPSVNVNTMSEQGYLSYIGVFQRLLSRCPNLEALSFENVPLFSSFEPLADSIVSTKLKVLRLVNSVEGSYKKSFNTIAQDLRQKRETPCFKSTLIPLYIRSLDVFKNLEWLDLSHNFITDEGVFAIIARETDEPLTMPYVYVNLSNNKITDDGLQALLDVKNDFPHIEALDLSYNLIQDGGFLPKINLSGNPGKVRIEARSRKRLEEAARQSLKREREEYSEKLNDSFCVGTLPSEEELRDDVGKRIARYKHKKARTEARTESTEAPTINPEEDPLYCTEKMEDILAALGED